MRKSLLALLLVVYTTVCAVGMPLTVYYCDGVFTGIGWQEQQGCCPADEDDCCANEHTVLKTDTEHANPPQLKQPTLTFVWLPTQNLCASLQTLKPTGLYYRPTLSKSPPPPDFSILFGIFLI